MANGKVAAQNELTSRLGYIPPRCWLPGALHCHLECLRSRSPDSVSTLRDLGRLFDASRQNRYGGVSVPSRLEAMSSSSVPGVTIIRPLCGLDNNLYHTLEAAMKLCYPKYEVIFALQDENDEAIPVVRMIMEKYPESNARIIIGKSDSAVVTIDCGLSSRRHPSGRQSQNQQPHVIFRASSIRYSMGVGRDHCCPARSTWSDGRCIHQLPFTSHVF